MKTETEKRQVIADVLKNLRDTTQSKRIFNPNYNTVDFRMYAASYLMGLIRGLSVSTKTQNQVERIIGI